MKMEVLAVQQQYQTQFSALGSNKIRDWTSTLTPPLSVMVKNSTSNTTITAAAAATASKSKSTPTMAININNNNNSTTTPYHLHHHHYNYNYNYNNHHRQTVTSNKMKNSIINKKTNRQDRQDRQDRQSAIETATVAKIAKPTPTPAPAPVTNITTTTNSNNFHYCDNNDIDAAAVNELSLRLLDELRAAKSRHLTCTEVSLPCDLTPSIAAEIIRVSEKEPCGIRGCTIYIEFEDEPNNSRRIASLKLDPETVSTFEVYLTLRQDHRGWASLLPQFMKSLARTITISPEFTITKHKLYSPQQRLSYTATTTASTIPISTAAAISTTATTTTASSAAISALSS